MGTRKTVGVLLAGCGHLDGAEIHEATLTLLMLDRAGAETRVFALDKPQMHVVDHRTGEAAEGESRNQLVEAARIARGRVAPLSTARADELDALVLPGGFGVAKNLCSFAVQGRAMSVDPEVERLLRELHRARKPMGFICIAPVIAAKVLGVHRPQLTIGADPDTAAVLASFGARHVVCQVDQAVVDHENRLVSTPAYMLAESIAPVAAGIERLVAEVLKLA
jgi:enhancing lycopene biosynthesis protein 2